MKLNTRQSKTIKFNVSVRGVQTRELKGNLRLVIEGIEYGFPAKVIDDTLTVTIPPLDEFIKKDLTEGQRIDAKLEVIANDTYINPWMDSLIVENPVTVEATVKEEITNEDDKPIIDVTMVVEEKPIVNKVEPKKKVKRSKFGEALVK